MKLNKLKYRTADASKHLIVISCDAFSEDNFEQAKNLPGFSSLLSLGSHSTKLKSVYPTLTYPVHTTMVTGVYPDKHGITHNNPFQPFVPENRQNWYWFRKDIKVPAIYDVANQQGLCTAGILWPVTGKAALRYNLPEIAAIKNESQIFKILKNGSPLFCLCMLLKYGRGLRGSKQPYLDDFSLSCALDIIKRKAPDLLLLHLIELDDAKHRYGTDSKEVERAIRQLDKRIGLILLALHKAGIMEKTVIAVVGDHGQFNVQKQVHLNNLLRDAGLIRQKNGTMTWRAYFQSAKGSAYLHIKPDDQEALDLTEKLLADIVPDSTYGIQQLYTRPELDKLHVDSSIQYMVEAQLGYSFSEALGQETIEEFRIQNKKYATHGYSPDKPNYRCILMISGTGIKQAYEIGEVKMVDLAPTFARILNLKLDQCDGKPLDEIFL